MPWMLTQIGLLFLAGWLIGGVINYLADVLPARRRLSRPFCPSCQAPAGISVYIVPRKCPACGSAAAVRAWIILACMALSTLWLWYRPPEGIASELGILLLAYFVLVTVIDIEHRLILHVISLVGVALGLIVGINLHGVTATVLGGLVGFFAMLALYMVGFGFLRLSARLRGRPVGEDEAIGFGDVNLSGVIGLLLGWPGIVAGLLIAIVLGGVISLLYLALAAIRRRYHPGLSLPYGPFLAASTIILLFTRSGG